MGGQGIFWPVPWPVGYNQNVDMLFAFFLILLLLVFIVATCSLFTNAIEWTGHRFKLSEGAVGSVLAAVGTALPETLVPIIAIVSGHMAGTGLSPEAGAEIGIGAILGAPFLLSTLAMCVTASALFYFAAMKKREARLKLDYHLFRRDLQYFFPAYVIVILAAFIHEPLVKTLIALGLLGFYGFYVYRTLLQEHVPDEEFDLPALMFAPRTKEPATSLILMQVVASLVLLLVLVHLFVDEIHHIATTLDISPLVLSLIITPIATELPEKFNSVVWVKNGKDNLALGNITGAMVFQSCIPTAIGLAFTPWVLNTQGLLSAGLCFASSLAIYLASLGKGHKQMPQVLFMAGGISYLAFLIYALLILAR